MGSKRKKNGFPPANNSSNTKKGSPNWSKLSTNISEHLTTKKNYTNAVHNMRKHNKLNSKNRKAVDDHTQSMNRTVTTKPLTSYNSSNCSVAVKEDMLRNKCKPPPEFEFQILINFNISKP